MHPSPSSKDKVGRIQDQQIRHSFSSDSVIGIMLLGFLDGLAVKNSPAMQEMRVWWIPEPGRSPGGGRGNPLQYSCLENSMDRGTWRVTVQRGTQSRTELKWLRMHARSYYIAQGTLFNVTSQPGWGEELGGQWIHVYYGWDPLPSTCNCHNIVNWLYSNIK